VTTGQLIDLVLEHWVNPGSNDANDATWRKRVLERGQEVVEEIWDADAWEFKQTTTTLSLTSGTDTVDVPSNWSTIGENGSLWITVGDRAHELEYMEPHRLLREREKNRNAGSGCPDYYTVTQQDATFLTQIIFDQTADQTYSLRLYYDSTPPILLDRPTALTATEVDSGSGGVAGTVSYRVVFVDSDGGESEAGATRSVTIVSSGPTDVALTSIPTGNSSVVSRKIYRTESGGSDYKLLTTLSDNTTTSYTDDSDDSSLGAAMTASATSSSLQRIPREFHRSVVHKGVKARIAPDFGDGRAADFDAEYRRELGSMKSRRRHGLDDPPGIGDEGISTLRMH
jgi:hypothetical protein